MVQRKVTYRLYPTAAQLAALEHQRWVHCLLWNEALAERRRAWSERQESLGFSSQCKRLTQWRRLSKLLRGLNAQSTQVTLKRLDLAFKHFFRRVKNGETPGFPRFKPLHRFKGWGYKTHGDGWRLITNERMKHGTLRLSGVGKIAIRGKPRTTGTPKTCEVLCRNGRWYASVTLNCEPSRQRGDELGGLDWGLETFATMATPAGTETIGNPRHLANSLNEIRRVQRHISRKEEAARKASGRQRRFPVSNRLQREYERLRRLHRKVANQRHDFQHQTTARLVGQFAVLGLEALNIRNMTASGGQYKKGLNRSILDAAGGAFHQLLGYKAEEAGTWAMEAPTRQLKPSQTCHACGRQEKKPLGQRRHECPCGASCSRDENAARVLMNWAKQQLSGRERGRCVEGGKTESSPDDPARPEKRETHAIA
ncbi:RNA-guided endonuclease TnpB family protein [Ectothiorhodospira sp. BSL-9]|uniref:RNA-guided endonuclease InsQ/TnpB family protein n=1 Tax=Ectothiorhodospira sp. BSL-9 TaxID=1442136 RepID=UPI0009EEFC7C|nr:RNA-guided endonuclease TnpB family protein [Ectothiorhodospira sp. BSL-9]